MSFAAPRSPHKPRFPTTLSTVRKLGSSLPMGRRHQRASAAILFVIIFFCAFTLFTHNSHPVSLVTPKFQVSELLVRREIDPSKKTFDPALHRSKPAKRPIPPALVMTPEEELAALVHFVTAFASNALPNVDPGKPIPPELLLGFNTRDGDRARMELDNVVQSTWFEHPVVIFVEKHSAKARELKGIIATYSLLPLPAIVEVDSRRDVDVIVPLIFRLTKRTSFPILIVGGTVMGSVEDIRTAHGDGSLQDTLADAGAVIGGSEKKKKKKLIVQLSDDQ
ncbi:hypothetical protein FRB99_000202 [Tulasnella sp. 403]|nr:hypothetical protein FRB99_000202 [Tulasnella sp. 403]